VRTKHKAKQAALVRLSPPAAEVVLGWVGLTNWSAAKVASELVLWASVQKGAEVIERLKREAEACSVIRNAIGKAAWIRSGKEVRNAKA
jgi:hypothetical protein